jgi:hypothetical protein
MRFTRAPRVFNPSDATLHFDEKQALQSPAIFCLVVDMVSSLNTCKRPSWVNHGRALSQWSLSLGMACTTYPGV